MARLVYLGTPTLAVAPLEALVAAGHEVVLVVSQPDARRGRGGATAPSPVKAAAIELGIETSEDPRDVLDADAELGVVVAYGRILVPAIVDALPLLNLHFSALPRWRGAAPVERAILAGDATTAVCVMAIEEGLDTGAVYARAEVPLERKTLDELRGELVDRGVELLLDCVANGRASLPTPVPQEGTATTAKKIRPDELHLDLSRPAVELDRVVRLGRAWTTDGDRRLRILVAHPAEGVVEVGALEGTRLGTGDGILVLDRVQPEGKAAMDAADWARGRRSGGLLGEIPQGGDRKVEA